MASIQPGLTQQRHAKDIAQELLGLIYRFSRLTSEATHASATQPEIWSQIIGELASQSLQGTLLASGQGSVDDITRDEWRRRFEGWIHRELQAEVDRTAAAAGRLSPHKGDSSGSGKPISPSVEVNGSPLFSNGGFSTVPAAMSVGDFGEGRGLPGFAYDGDPLMSAMSVDDNFSFNSQIPSPVQAFSSYPPSQLDLSSPFGTSPNNRHPPTGDPLSFFGQTTASSSTDAFSSTSSFPLSSPGLAQGSSTGTATPIEQTSHYDLNAAFQRIGVQPPSTGDSYGVGQTDWQTNQFVLPQAGPDGMGSSLYPPIKSRASSSSLPRLITSDLSSPTSGGSLSAPGFDGGNLGGDGSSRPRSRSHGAQERPQGSDLLSPATVVGAGSSPLGHRRGSSAGSHSPRYHPFSAGGGTSPVLPPTGFDGSLAAPFSASAGGASSPGGASSTGSSSHRRTKSATNSRTERTLAYDPTAIFHRNTRPVFAVHLQNSTKAEVSERDVIELTLATDEELARAPQGANSTNMGTALWRAAAGEDEYEMQQREEDVREARTFTFVSAPQDGSAALRLPGHEEEDSLRRTQSLSSSTGSSSSPNKQSKTYWQVTYDNPLEPFAPRITALSSTPRTAFQPTLTFLHFPPGMLILTKDHQLGSKEWWRIQECPGRHEKQPGDGAWTSRWDADGEERRPSRVLLHYATCVLRKGDGEGWTLGRMARAIRECKKKA